MASTTDLTTKKPTTNPFEPYDARGVDEWLIHQMQTRLEKARQSGKNLHHFVEHIKWLKLKIMLEDFRIEHGFLVPHQMGSR